MSNLALKVEFEPAFLPSSVFEVRGDHLRFEAYPIIDEGDYCYTRKLEDSVIAEFIQNCEKLLLKEKTEQLPVVLDGITVHGKLINIDGKELEFEFLSPDKESYDMEFVNRIFSLIEGSPLPEGLSNYFKELQSYFE